MCRALAFASSLPVIPLACAGRPATTLDARDGAQALAPFLGAFSEARILVVHVPKGSGPDAQGLTAQCITWLNFLAWLNHGRRGQREVLTHVLVAFRSQDSKIFDRTFNQISRVSSSHSLCSCSIFAQMSAHPTLFTDTL
jgi:hypothetical protein